MKKRKRVFTAIALLATKGGVGKTTLASALAVRASDDSGRVALIDADPQATLEKWWNRRVKHEGDGSNPKILGLEASAEGLGLAMAEGWEWCFIDTPPGNYAQLETCVEAIDFALIPCRPSTFDIEAVLNSAAMCRERGKPYAFVINQVDSSVRGLEVALQRLRGIGPVLDKTIAFRRSYIQALNIGRSGPEVERGETCASEIDGVWAAVKEMVR